LGAARAVTTIQFVQERSGLEPTKFIATSYGEYRPVTTNDTAAGRRKNRRVEIYVRYELLMNSIDLDSLMQELPDLSQFEKNDIEEI
jgi:chemotaxis protein MotB